MRRFTLLSVVAVAGAVAAVPGPVVAADDNCGRAVHSAGPYYFTYNDGAPDYHWIYEESNNNAGLQAGGEGGATGHSLADDCQRPNPDKMIY